MKFKVLIVVLLISTFGYGIFGGDIRLTDHGKILLSDDPMLGGPASFCVTEDNKFIVSDFKLCDIKIYDSKGKFLKVFGSMGFGPNEFGQLLAITYSKKMLIVSDVAQKKFFIYERKGDLDFVRTKEIRSSIIGFDLKLQGNELYITGDITSPKNETYCIFSLNIKENNRLSYILPAHIKYGLNSENEYQHEVLGKRDYGVIGRKGRIDIVGNVAYYYWEGDLKIFKIDLEKKTFSTFGEKTSHYRKPSSSNKLINALSSRDMNTYASIKGRMSYLSFISASPKYVLLIYTSCNDAKDYTKMLTKDDIIMLMQVYSLDGKFLKEILIPGDTGNEFFFDKRENILYTIIYAEDKDYDLKYAIQKYKFND